HWRRGAICRYGTLWPTSDPGDLVYARASVFAPELLRPIGSAAAASQRREQSILFTGSLLGPLSHGRRGHRRGRGRVAGIDFRGLLAHETGGPAGLQSEGNYRPHIEERDGADLYSGSEPVAL